MVRREMNFFISEKNMKRVSIACRCGTRSVHEVPEELCELLAGHTCPGCTIVYAIHRHDDGKWCIRRTEWTKDQLDLMHDAQHQVVSKYKH